MRITIGDDMKQQDAYKLLAAFLVFTMLGSVFAYMFTGPIDNTETTNAPETNPEKYNSEFWTVNQPFYSISDALIMTPPGVVTADFVDLESMTPQMMEWARTNGAPIINEVDSIYNSNTTKMYYSNLFDGKNNSFLLLSAMYPQKNDFEYIERPDTYPPILIRKEQGINGIYNIMGNPVIFAPPQTAVDVLNIIYSQNKTATAYDQYEGLLGKVEPAPFQILDSNVTFAKQFYMGIRETNGSYERTTAYLNINSSALKKLNQLKANSTQKGITQYNINTSGNYTIVSIVSPQLTIVADEDTN